MEPFDQYQEKVSFPTEDFLAMVRYSSTPEFQKSFEILEKFYSTNADKCDPLFLDAEYNSWKGFIYSEQNNHEKALHFYEISLLPIEVSSARYFHIQHCIMLELYKLKRFEECILKIEIVFNQANQSRVIFEVEGPLYLYGSILDETKKEFPGKYEYLVKELLDILNIKKNAINFSSNISIVEKIKKIKDLHIEANHRYGYMIMEVRKLEDSESKLNRLKKYIQQENVGYYKAFAIEAYKEIEGKI